jgi:drug/metabolite transporter (DMT)-like permease
VAAGSQTAAALLLLPFAVATWPATTPEAGTWAAAIALGVLCTGVAYILYFRLIARLGPATALTVTFMIPAFAMLWGGLFLGEDVTLTMLTGCAVILGGTALATGLIRSRRPASATSTGS